MRGQPVSGVLWGSCGSSCVGLLLVVDDSLQPDDGNDVTRRTGSAGVSAVQLLSLPQLDAIQRSLRILDVRLQHVQSNVITVTSSRQRNVSMT